MADTEDLATQVETAPPPAEPKLPEPTPPRRAAFLPLVAGGVVAAAIGFATAQFVPQVFPQADTSQQADLDALSARLTALESAPQAQPDADLANRIAALEASTDLAPLLARLDALEQGLTALKSAPASDPAALAALQLQIDALKQGGVPAVAMDQAEAALDAKLAEVQSSLAAVKSEAEALAATANRNAALRQVQSALDSGAPYATALPLLGDLPPVLTDNAVTGLPTLQSLRDSFPDMARTALEQALAANMGQSWTERVTNFLRGQTGARSLTPREGSDPDAILSRMEAALASADLPTVLTESAALPPAALAALAPWLDRVQQRQDAVAAVADLASASGM